MFAESRVRDELGILEYPRDIELRKQYGFIEESFDHPAKMNLYLLQDLIEYTTKPGDRIMDVTAGSGSVLIACKLGRKVVAIDLNPLFIGWMNQSAVKMGLVPTDYTILEGDCRDYLPLPCSSIIFSPPYSNMLHAGGGILNREKLGGQLKEYSGDTGVVYDPDQYIGTNPKNLGVLPEFRFNQAMEQIYKKCFDSVQPGGALSLIIKDRMMQQKIRPLGWQSLQMMQAAGWVLDTWATWDAPGMQFKNIHKAQGHKVIESEHILIVRRPA